MASLLLVTAALLSATVTAAADSANIRVTCWTTASFSEDLVAVARDEQRCCASAHGRNFRSTPSGCCFGSISQRIACFLNICCRAKVRCRRCICSCLFPANGDLASFYERADMLLYDGRNKTRSAFGATSSSKDGRINKASRA